MYPIPNMVDPTLVTLAQLNDPKLYVRVDNVPIFCPHQRRLKNGQTLTVDQADLHGIADNDQERQASGSLVRLTLGHMLQGQGVPEDKQPKPVGYARITNVTPFGPGGKIGLKSTWYIKREDYGEAKTYPFRSPEYYPDTNTISGIALLRRDPELDLGTLSYVRASDGTLTYETYEAGGRLCLHYAMGASTMPQMTHETNLDEAAETVKGSKSDEMDVAKGEDAGYKTFEGYAKKHPLLKYLGDNHHVIRYMCNKYMADAGAAPPMMGNEAGAEGAVMPGSSNTYVPGMAGDEEARKAEMMQRSNGTRVDYARELADLRKENLETKKQLGAIYREKRLGDFRNKLQTLASDGIVLNLEEELQYCSEMTPAEFEKHAARISVHYQRAPVETGIGPFAVVNEPIKNGNGHAANGQAPLTREERDRVVQYATENGIVSEKEARAVCYEKGLIKKR